MTPNRKIKLAITGIAVVLVATVVLVGTALAQPPTPNNPAPPPTKEQVTAWMENMMESVHGEGSFEQMKGFMDEIHGPGSFDQMTEWMSQGGGCGAFLNGDNQTGGTPPQGTRGGMMGRGASGMMGGGFFQ